MRFPSLLQPLLGDFIEQLGLRKSEGTDEDDWQFLEFEVKLNQVTLNSALDGPINKLNAQEGIRDELKYFREKIHQQIHQALGIDAPQKLDSPLYDDDDEEDKHLLTQQYATNVVENGFVDVSLERAFLPTSAQDLRQTVDRFRNINERLERQYIMGFADTSCESSGETESTSRMNDTIGAHAERLYQLLAKESNTSTEHKHEVLIQLSGFNESSVRKVTAFEMLLSTCPTSREMPTKLDWQDTLCTLEMGPSRDDTSNSSLCRHICTSKNHRLLLHLSFSDSMLWARRPFQTTRQQCRHPSSFLGLHEILDRGLLRDESLVNRIKRSRLALQLAVALQQLYMGPWLQRNWRAEVVRFLYQEDTHTIDRLDQPFISCQLLQDWTRNTTIFDEAYRQVDDCPQFFLHFAQLLVDIAKGERDINLDTDVALPNWYTALDEHITLNFQNGLLKSYGKAIRGCLHYSVEYNLAKTRLRDPKLRAKTVINEHIVRHLRRNLKMWEEVRDREDHVLALPRSGDSYEKLPPGNRETHGHNTVAQCHIIDPQVHKRPLDDAEFVLFADDDALYEPEERGISQNGFIQRMTKHILQYMIRLPEKSGNRIRIAVLDTGLHMDDSDNLLSGGKHRIGQQKNFVDPTSPDCNDTHGHGTHVIRILLRFAPRAQIVVGKVSEGRFMKQTKGLEKILAALQWAGDNADIINLSFGIGMYPIPSIQSAIKDLVMKGKLIFAAASNAGGNGSRAYPASEKGVFCIHATDANGDKAPGMNPAPWGRPYDNFSTLGIRIDSVWAQQDVYISGTSYATPIAATIAANALEYARCSLSEYDEKRERFLQYGFVHRLFVAMVKESTIDGYDYLKPWVAGMWVDQPNEFEHEGLCQKLREFAVGAHP